MFHVACAIVAAAIVAGRLLGQALVYDVAFVLLLAIWPRGESPALPLKRGERTDLERLVIRAGTIPVI